MDCSAEEIQFSDNRCPAAGFLPLYHHFGTWWNNQDTGYSFELGDPNFRKSMYARPALISDSNTWAYTAHAATATLQDAVRDLHNRALGYLTATSPLKAPFPAHLTWADPMRYEVKTKALFVRVLCEPQGMVDLWGSNLTVKFPNIPAFDAYWKGKPPPPGREPLPAPKTDGLDVLELVKQHLVARGILNDITSPMTPDVFSESRPILIVPIDMWKYSGSSLGLVVFPQNTWNRTNSDLTPPSNVVACSVDARWSEAKTVMEVRKSTALMHEFHLGRVRNLVGTELLLQEFPRNPGYARYIPSDDRMPVIRMTPSWYDGLSPMFPDAPSILPYLPAIGTKQTTREVLMSLVYTWWGTRQTELENVISTILADGSSRCGLIDNYNASRFLEAWDCGSWDVDNEKLARAMVRQGAPVETFPEPFILKSGNVTRMEMKAIYSGYVMSATGWFDYLSIIALLLHALIALVHAVLVVFYGKMSGAWDTILELVALAQMSTPPPEPLLANASAGTRSFKTVRIVAWVEAPRAGAASPAELGGELQMRFSQQTDQRDPSLKPTIGSVYGSTA